MLVFNCHVPSTGDTDQRKRDVVQKVMEVGNEAQGSGVAQLVAAWIVRVDMDFSHSQLVSLCFSFVKPSKPCFSKSGMQRTKDAQKSRLLQFPKGLRWCKFRHGVGDHFPPCVSDAHGMLLLAGALEGIAGALREAAATLHSLPPGNQGQTRSYRDVLVRQPAMPSRPTPRDGKPPVPPAAHAEMQRGEPSSSEPALPRATAPVDVALASDDSHLARYTPRSSRRAELCEVSTGPPLWALPPPSQGQAPLLVKR